MIVFLSHPLNNKLQVLQLAWREKGGRQLKIVIVFERFLNFWTQVYFKLI